MTVLTAYDLGPVYLCSPISCWFGASRYTPVTWKHSQVLNSPSCVQSMHVLSVLCSSGLEIPGSPSELSGQHFLLRMLSWPRNDRSSCPLPWPIWFRCSFLRVPGARSVRALSKPYGNFVYWSVMLTRLSFFWGQGVIMYISVYIPIDSKSTRHLERARWMFLKKNE